MMLTPEQKSGFDKNGFVLIPNVIKPEQVKGLRGFLRPKFDHSDKLPGDTEDVLTDIYSRYPEMRWLLFHEPTLSILRDLLGEDFVVIRESAVHLNRFGGWHKDTTSMEMNGWDFVCEKDYLMVEVAYYLQDNSPEFGGGLDVEPGSHRKRDPFIGIKGKPLWQRHLFKKTTETTYFIQDGHRFVKNPLSVPSKAGDLVIFNLRVNHQATQIKNKSIPRPCDKLAVFGVFSRKNRHVDNYHRFLQSRPDPKGVYAYMKNASYPVALAKSAEAAGINLA